MKSPVKVEADWDNAKLSVNQQGKSATIFIPNIHLVASGGPNVDLQVGELSDTFALVEKQPVKSKLIHLGNMPNVYYEVLDAVNEIFAVGLK